MYEIVNNTIFFLIKHRDPRPEFDMLNSVLPPSGTHDETNVNAGLKAHQVRFFKIFIFFLLRISLLSFLIVPAG